MMHSRLIQTILHSTFKTGPGTSLLVQWLRVCLSTQGTRVRPQGPCQVLDSNCQRRFRLGGDASWPLSVPSMGMCIEFSNLTLLGEDPTCQGATKPRCHHHTGLRAYEGIHCNERPAHCSWRVAPARHI